MVPTTDPTLDPKPGYTTTEFWLTLGTAVFALVSALAVALHKQFVPDGDARAIVLAAAPIAAMIGTAFYTLSRAKVKAAHADTKALALHLDATANQLVAERQAHLNAQESAQRAAAAAQESAQKAGAAAVAMQTGKE